MKWDPQMGEVQPGRSKVKSRMIRIKKNPFYNFFSLVLQSSTQQLSSLRRSLWEKNEIEKLKKVERGWRWGGAVYIEMKRKKKVRLFLLFSSFFMLTIKVFLQFACSFFNSFHIFPTETLHSSRKSKDPLKSFSQHFPYCVRVCVEFSLHYFRLQKRLWLSIFVQLYCQQKKDCEMFVNFDRIKKFLRLSHDIFSQTNNHVSIKERHKKNKIHEIRLFTHDLEAIKS